MASVVLLEPCIPPINAIRPLSSLPSLFAAEEEGDAEAEEGFVVAEVPAAGAPAAEDAAEAAPEAIAPAAEGTGAAGTPAAAAADAGSTVLGSQGMVAGPPPPQAAATVPPAAAAGYAGGAGSRAGQAVHGLPAAAVAPPPVLRSPRLASTALSPRLPALLPASDASRALPLALAQQLLVSCQR